MKEHKPEFYDRFKDLVENDRILLGCLSTGKEVDVKKVKDLGVEQIRIINSFEEEGFNIEIPPTVHELWYHLAEKIEENQNHGLKQFR